MASKKGDTHQSFNHSVQNKQAEKEIVKTVPKMIREDQSVPRPKPPSIGKAIDAQSFNRRWQQEVNAAKPLDAFDAIDKQQEKLNQQFNEIAKTGKKQGLERN